MKKLLLVALALSCVPAWADDSIAVREAYARATAPTVSTGAVFMKIDNRGSDDDVLLGAQAEPAQKIELHRTLIDEHGVMHMREAREGIKLAAGETVVLAPGSWHIMLLGLRRPLSAGQSFDISLDFKKQGRLKVPVSVIAGTGGEPADSEQDHRAHRHAH